jgi:nucleoside-diphosphate-sugar epimerase
MQNLDTTHRADIVEHNDLFIPAGNGRTAFIDVRDIGAVAARVLTEPGHENTTYALTGRESLTYGEVADIMSAELGRPITYSDPSPLAFARRMRRRGHPWGYIAVMEGIYLTTRLGRAELVYPEASHLLGRAPITMRQYVRDYAAAFSC